LRQHPHSPPPLHACREHSGRRLLQQQLQQQAQRKHHTHSEAWGTLRGAHQLLLTHAPQLSADERAELVAAVEAAGCHVAAYVPDSSLLLVGAPQQAAALEAHTAVLRLALHEEQDRLAPEWQHILEQLEQQQFYRGQLSANATRAAVAAVLAQLSVAAQWDAAAQQLLIGAAVSFPTLAVPAASRGLAAEAEAPRTRRVMLQRQAQDAGAAAAADWAPRLASLFGARLQRTSPETALVLAPAPQLGRVLQWLAQRPAVHWVDPAPKLRLNNAQASSITQSAKPFPRDGSMLDAGLHPLWAAGITGRGQVIGCGDSGLDVYHCFFVDPSIDLKVTVVDGKRTFDSPDHRKIRYYRAYADTEDSNGHGTHVSGTLVGMPYGTTLESKPSGGNVGMAPDAKIAFIDLGDSSSDTISTPSDLANSYFPYTTGVGAAIHSDSWGATNIYYDFLARQVGCRRRVLHTVLALLLNMPAGSAVQAGWQPSCAIATRTHSLHCPAVHSHPQVDLYAWENPDFLPVFAAGNDGGKAKPGTMATPAGASPNGDYTVTSPANAKNCLSVGATQVGGQGFGHGIMPPLLVVGMCSQLQEGRQPASCQHSPLQTTNEAMETTAVKYVVWDATVTEGDYTSTFKVMQASFGGSVSVLTGGKEYAMVVAQPLEACTPLQNDAAAVKGAIVLVQRGESGCKRMHGCVVGARSGNSSTASVAAAAVLRVRSLSSRCIPSHHPPTGTCAFSEKAQAAQDAGAAGVLIYDNVLQAYFTWGGDDAVAASITIPVMSVTRRLGLSLVASASVGKAVTLSFATPRAPDNSFENLASYSSQGPTTDKRVKPDILAPGTITSAAVGLGSSEDCSLTTMAGTSMATPVVAGSAALVRQYFMDGYYPSGTRASDKGFTPSAALVKAVLLGGAASITGFEADTGLPVDPTPSFRQGFGRVFLGETWALSGLRCVFGCKETADGLASTCVLCRHARRYARMCAKSL
jgi:subtilisin family serine protease